MLKKRNKIIIIIIIIKNYSKKTPKASCWLQADQANFAGPFGCSRLRGCSLSLLLSDQHSAPLSPALWQPWVPQVQARTLPRAVCVWGLLCCILILVPRMWSQVPLRCILCLVSWMWSQVSLHGVDSHQCLRFGLDAPNTPAGVPGSRVERGVELMLQKNCPNFPRVSLFCFAFLHFFFLRKSSCSILPLHTRKGLSSHTAHLSS